MSKATMLEPVAYRSKESPYLFSLGGPETDGFDGLITTTQAEAYKDACVREALEEAAQLCQSEGDEWDSDGVVTNKNYAHACRDRVRDLIPKQ